MQAQIDAGLATVRNVTAPVVEAVWEKQEDVKQRVVDFSVHVGIDADADTVLVIAGASLALVGFLLLCLCRLLSHARHFSRVRMNRIMVEMADSAPVDDGDEHELEQHGRLRAAAPGDSDMEEDHFAPPGAAVKEGGGGGGATA